MDNEIIDELKVFTEAQKEKMTTTINALIEKNEEALGQAHRESFQIGESLHQLAGKRVDLNEELATIFSAMFLGDEGREEIDKIQSEIADLRIRQSEIPQLEQASQPRIAQAITKLRGARQLTRKLDHCYKLQIQIIEIATPEPPNTMIRDLHLYASEIPGGQKFFTEFIAKLQLKYPDLGSKEL